MLREWIRFLLGLLPRRDTRQFDPTVRKPIEHRLMKTAVAHGLMNSEDWKHLLLPVINSIPEEATAQEVMAKVVMLVESYQTMAPSRILDAKKLCKDIVLELLPKGSVREEALRLLESYFEKR